MRAAETAPVPVPAGPGGSWEVIRATGLQAGRVMRRSLRMRPVLIQTIFFPVLLLVVLLLVFGEIAETVSRPGDVPYVERLVPLMVLTSALFGGLGGGTALVAERDSGLLARFATLPVPRASVLAGRVVGDTGRAFVGAVVLVAAGYAGGFRFERGVVGAVGFFAVAIGYGSAFCWLVTAVAIRARTYESVLVLTPVFLTLLFFNAGIVPVSDYPGFVQPLISVAPHTCAARAMIALSHGGAVLGPLLGAVAWSAAIVAVSAPVAARGFRDAGARGR